MSEPSLEPKPKKRSRYPGTQKRGAGWCYVIELGKDPATGKRRQQQVSEDPTTGKSFRTQREAFAARCEAQAKLRNGTYTEPSKQTVKEYLDYWLRQQEPHLRPASIRKYRTVIDTILVPSLGSIVLTQLRAPAIQELITRLLKGGRTENTVRQYVDVLDFALKFAVRQQTLVHNPCQGVRKPVPPTRKPRGLALPEAKLLLEHLADHEQHLLRIPVLLALFAGCRQGEVVGLRWRDVDFERCLITIQQQLQEPPGGKGWELGPTKGHKPGDDPPPPQAMPGLLRDELRIHRASQAAHRLKRERDDYVDHDFVVARRDGLPYRGSYIAQEFRELALHLKLSETRFHALRGTGSSLMLAANVPLPVVSEWLRHRNPMITARAYSFVQPDSHQAASHTLDQIFRPSAGDEASQDEVG